MKKELITAIIFTILSIYLVINHFFPLFSSTINYVLNSLIIIAFVCFAIYSWYKFIKISKK